MLHTASWSSQQCASFWNVWGRYGDESKARQAGIEDELVEAGPDLVGLVEAWRQGEATQPELIAKRLDLPHHRFDGDWEQEDWVSEVGFLSRWPMSDPMRRPLRDASGAGFGQTVHVVVDGERGPIQLFIAMLDYQLDASAMRQAQTRQLARFVSEVTRRRFPTVVCADFNAGPDSDEIRMLTGRTATAVPGLVFYDAWEVAGDGTAGHTWTNHNPLAAIGLYPDRRFRLHPVRLATPKRGWPPHPLPAAGRYARLTKCSCPTTTESSQTSGTERGSARLGLPTNENSGSLRYAALSDAQTARASLSDAQTAPRFVRRYGMRGEGCSGARKPRTNSANRLCRSRHAVCEEPGMTARAVRPLRQIKSCTSRASNWPEHAALDVWKTAAEW